MADLFYDYFLERWQLERNKNGKAMEKNEGKDGNFLFAPTAARKKCSELISDAFM